MKRIIALGAIVAFVVIGWSGAWLYAAGRIKAEADTLGTPGNAYGVTLTCTELGISGFPFRFDVTCREASLAEGDLSFSLAELHVTARVYRLNHILIFAKGPFAYSDAFFGTEQQLDWSLFEASVRVENNRLARASVVTENLIWSDMLIGKTDLGTAARIEAHLVPLDGDGASAKAGLALFVAGNAIDAPAYDIENGRVTLEAEVEDFPADVTLWTDPGLLARWQANGGQVNLIRLEADDAGATLSANGTLRLSATGYPEADLKVKSTGLAEKFALDPQSQTMFFGTDTGDGTRNQTIIVREGSILVGLVPSGRLAPWF